MTLKNPLKSSFMKAHGPIVIIDDDPDDHEILKLSCRNIEMKNEIRSFFNGPEAIRYLETTDEKPFIILCDLNMPVMNGIELRQRIQSSEYLRRKSIPFVFTSTAAVPQTINEAYKLTIQGYFLKGTTLSETDKCLRMIFDYWELCLHPNSFEK